MLKPRDVSACLVTRGNVNLEPIVATIRQAGIRDVQVWDNSAGDDLGVYGRYAAMEGCEHDVVYVQDDDCVLPAASIRGLIKAYQPGVIAANMPQHFRNVYTDSCLIGFGAVFDRDLPPAAFKAFGGASRRPDVVFTALTPREMLDVPVTILPYAYGADRAYRQPGHSEERRRVLEQARLVRGRAVAA